MCDPGLRRRHSSECEEDSLPEVYMDSGLSTLRGSHAGYDSEQEVSKGQEEEAEEERAKVRREANSHSGTMGENSDTEVRRRFSDTWRSTVGSLTASQLHDMNLGFSDRRSLQYVMNIVAFFLRVSITGGGDSGCRVSIWIRQQLSSGMETV